MRLSIIKNNLPGVGFEPTHSYEYQSLNLTPQTARPTWLYLLIVLYALYTKCRLDISQFSTVTNISKHCLKNIWYLLFMHVSIQLMNSIVELSLVIQPCFYILKEPTILEFTYLHIFISFLKVLNGNRPICIFLLQFQC